MNADYTDMNDSDESLQLSPQEMQDVLLFVKNASQPARSVED
jgi:hypothetical protein